MLEETKIKAWESFSDREVYSNFIMSVKARESENPRNGHRGTYFHFGFPNWVNVIALTADNEVVVTRQYRHGSAKIELEIPGGVIDPIDNDPLAGGLRELREETGYTGEGGELIGDCCPNPALQGNFCYTVLVRNCTASHAVDLDDGEDIEVLTVPLSEIRQLICSGQITNSMVIAAFYFLEGVLREEENSKA